MSRVRKWVEASIGGDGYREWIGEKFEPEAARQLQANYDKLCADLTADVERRIAADLRADYEAKLRDKQ